jgi:hypothetical protein
MEGSPMEIEATQAASILYGSTGFTSTHKFWNLFLSPAMIHVRETCSIKYPQCMEKSKIAVQLQMSGNTNISEEIPSFEFTTKNIVNYNNIDELPDDKHIRFLRNNMDKMNINDQGGVLEYKMNSQNEIIFADTQYEQNIEEEKEDIFFNNIENIGHNITDDDFNDNEEVTMDPEYTYVDIDELNSIDIVENHIQEDDENDRGLREIVYDIQNNPMMLMQHNYYM